MLTLSTWRLANASSHSNFPDEAAAAVELSLGFSIIPTQRAAPYCAFQPSIKIGPQSALVYI
jgi:hypothetical protein